MAPELQIVRYLYKQNTVYLTLYMNTNYISHSHCQSVKRKACRAKCVKCAPLWFIQNGPKDQMKLTVKALLDLYK